jgi:hypothetical protein
MGKYWYSFHAGEDPMNSSGLKSLIFFVSLVALAQSPELKEMPVNKGNIQGGNTYYNPALSMTISLPGSWHFFDRTMYSTPESLQKDKEWADRIRSGCSGPLCGHAEIDVALQSPSTPPLVHAIYLTAYKLSPEYQNRERHPLKRFAEIMSLDSLGDAWVPDGELTAIQLDGRPAYRLILHDKKVPTAKGLVYVADSNGRVFMLVGAAVSKSEELRSAIENMRLTNAAN